MGQYADLQDLLLRLQHVVEFSETSLRSVNQRGIFGNTLLKVAVVWGDIEAVGVLLDADADIDAKNEDGYTALHWAASLGHQEIAELLIARGASRHIANDDGATPLEFAIDNGDQAMVRLLQHGGLA